MKPDPESPLHSVPSQSKTATLGLQSRTSRSNSSAVHLGISICAVVNSPQPLAKISLTLFSTSRPDNAREDRVNHSVGKCALGSTRPGAGLQLNSVNDVDSLANEVRQCAGSCL